MRVSLGTVRFSLFCRVCVLPLVAGRVVSHVYPSQLLLIHSSIVFRDVKNYGCLSLNLIWCISPRGSLSFFQPHSMGVELYTSSSMSRLCLDFIVWIWAIRAAKRMFSFTTRIEDNSFRRERVWCIFPRGSFSFSQLHFMGGKLHANSCMALLFLGLIVWISRQETRRGVLFGQKQAQTIQQCAWHFTRNQAGFYAPLSPRSFGQN